MEKKYEDNNEKKIDKYPKISIITPCHNHDYKLLLINFSILKYPKNKLEWIIIDDGNNSFENQIENQENIRYIKVDNKTIKELNNKYKKMKKKNEKNINSLYHGLKLNIAVSKGTGEYIMHMYPNTLYNPDILLHHIEKINENIECIGSNIRCNFDKKYYISSVDKMENENKILFYENTLFYKKSFWEKNKFENITSINLVNKFIRNKINNIKLYDPIKYIINIYTLDEKKVDDEYKNKQNGWHFWKIPDNLFLLITEN